jgi:hypothetical protein
LSWRLRLKAKGPQTSQNDRGFPLDDEGQSTILPSHIFRHQKRVNHAVVFELLNMRYTVDLLISLSKQSRSMLAESASLD